jgi:calcineurin-like phosphoesterase family protein
MQRWERNTKMNHRETGCGYVNWSMSVEEYMIHWLTWVIMCTAKQNEKKREKKKAKREERKLESKKERDTHAHAHAHAHAQCPVFFPCVVLFPKLSTSVSPKWANLNPVSQTQAEQSIITARLLLNYLTYFMIFSF